MNGLNFLQLYQRVSFAAIWARLAKSAVLWPLCRILTEQLHQCQQEAEDGFGWSQLGTQLSARCAALGRHSASKQILSVISFKLYGLGMYPGLQVAHFSWCCWRTYRNVLCLCKKVPGRLLLSPRWGDRGFLDRYDVIPTFQDQKALSDHVSSSVIPQICTQSVTSREESSLDVETSGDRLQHFFCILFQ